MAVRGGVQLGGVAVSLMLFFLGPPRLRKSSTPHTALSVFCQGFTRSRERGRRRERHGLAYFFWSSGHRARTNTSDLNPAPHRHGGPPQLASGARKKHIKTSQTTPRNPIETHRTNSHRARSNTSELNPAPHRHGGAPQLASRLCKKADIDLVRTSPS